MAQRTTRMTHGRSSGEAAEANALAARIAHTRGEMSKTIAAIAERLSPDRLAAEAMDAVTRMADQADAAATKMADQADAAATKLMVKAETAADDAARDALAATDAAVRQISE